MLILSIALMFFLVANPIGNSPAILAIIKDFDFQRQKIIMFRESIFALSLAVFFQFFGDDFLRLINVEGYSLGICGGTLLFLVALSMIFPKHENDASQSVKQEPYFVPIATPLITGPGLMTMIMIKSQELQNNMLILGAILIAWIGVTFVLVTSPYLLKLFGRKGLVALEQLMGMLLALMSMAMIVNGFQKFYQTLP